MSLTGYENQDPVRVGTSIGDITAGLFTTIGIQAAFNKKKFNKARKLYRYIHARLPNCYIRKCSIQIL